MDAGLVAGARRRQGTQVRFYLQNFQLHERRREKTLPPHPPSHPVCSLSVRSPGRQTCPELAGPCLSASSWRLRRPDAPGLLPVAPGRLWAAAGPRRHACGPTTSSAAASAAPAAHHRAQTAAGDGPRSSPRWEAGMGVLVSRSGPETWEERRQDEGGLAAWEGHSALHTRLPCECTPLPGQRRAACFLNRGNPKEALRGAARQQGECTPPGTDRGDR